MRGTRPVVSGLSRVEHQAQQLSCMCRSKRSFGWQRQHFIVGRQHQRVAAGQKAADFCLVAPAFKPHNAGHAQLLRLGLVKRPIKTRMTLGRFIFMADRTSPGNAAYLAHALKTLLHSAY
jgi:hypothetical protein